MQQPEHQLGYGSNTDSAPYLEWFTCPRSAYSMYTSRTTSHKSKSSRVPQVEMVYACTHMWNGLVAHCWVTVYLHMQPPT